MTLPVPMHRYEYTKLTPAQIGRALRATESGPTSVSAQETVFVELGTSMRYLENSVDPGLGNDVVETHAGVGGGHSQRDTKNTER